MRGLTVPGYRMLSRGWDPQPPPRLHQALIDSVVTLGCWTPCFKYQAGQEGVQYVLDLGFRMLSNEAVECGARNTFQCIPHGGDNYDV